LREEGRTSDVSKQSSDAGYSLIEVLIVLVMTVTMAAIAIPKTSVLFGNLRLSGDARGLSNHIALAKMRAAADFTRARLYVDLGARDYRIERFQKTGVVGWVLDTPPTSLSYRVNYGTGSLATPPPNTQAAIGQALPCLDNAGAPIANTACVVFNSRGIPIDNIGSPTAADALYITDGTAVYGITVAATGLIRTWKSSPNAALWTKQ
jgi:hypothetical protein